MEVRILFLYTVLSIMSSALPSAVPDALSAMLWRGTQWAQPSAEVCPTGFAALDAELPGGGWPTRSLTEILLPAAGARARLEWRLLLPGLRPVLASGRALVLVTPPHPPFLPGLAQAGVSASQVVWVQGATQRERLWATEQVLRDAGGPSLGALIVWLPQAQPAALRRLQTWALGCDALFFVVRPGSAMHEASPAPLRLGVRLQQAHEIGVTLLKRRGPLLMRELRLAAWPPGLEAVVKGALWLRRQKAPVPRVVPSLQKVERLERNAVNETAVPDEEVSDALAVADPLL